MEESKYAANSGPVRCWKKVKEWKSCGEEKERVVGGGRWRDGGEKECVGRWCGVVVWDLLDVLEEVVVVKRVSWLVAVEEREPRVEATSMPESGELGSVNVGGGA